MAFSLTIDDDYIDSREAVFEGELRRSGMRAHEIEAALAGWEWAIGRLDDEQRSGTRSMGAAIGAVRSEASSAAFDMADGCVDDDRRWNGIRESAAETIHEGMAAALRAAADLSSAVDRNKL